MENVIETLIAEDLLAAGEHPLTKVRVLAKTMEPGRLIRILSGFKPVPMIEMLGGKGYMIFSHEVGEGRFETFIMPVGE